MTESQTSEARKYDDPKIPDRGILQVMNISDKDFESNREGLLSSHQLETLQNQFSRGLIIKSAILLFMVAMAIIPFSMIGKTPLETVIGFICFLFIARLIFSFLRSFLKNQMAFYRDIQDGRVNSISGIPQLHGDKSNLTRSIRVSNKTFLISLSLVEAISVTEEYVFYYMPQSEVLVAIEKIYIGDRSII